MPLKRKKIFILVSILILLINMLFVVINYQSDKQTLYESLEETGERRGKEFFLALDMTEKNMQQFAMLLASEKEVQTLFNAGRKAVFAEGGGQGRSLSAEYRKALYNRVSERWRTMTSQYHIRHLQFHLGPGSLSFLRVHKPEKFGDRMDNVRFTIVDSNHLQKPTHGLEIGRYGSGIRGAVPVYFSNNQGEKKHIGTLEAGTSFTLLLKYLKTIRKGDFAILLELEQVKKKVWPDYLHKMDENGQIVGSTFIEATTDMAQLRHLLPLTTQTNQGVVLCEHNNEGYTHAVKRIKLRDYRGTVDSTLPAVGEVMIWFDSTTAVNNFWRGVKVNILYAVIGFILLELLLYAALQRITTGLHQIIEDQRIKLEKSQALVLHSEKMASVGHLAAGVAHEINNPIGFISSNLSSLKKYSAKVTNFMAEMNASMPLDIEQLKALEKKHKIDFVIADIQDLIEESLDGTTRVAEIVSNLKGFAHQDGTDKKKMVDINDCLDQSIKLVHNELKYKAEITKDYQLIPNFKCISNQLSQVFINLLVNASHAIKDHGKINIQTQSRKNLIVIEIKDTGCGMTNETMQNIFTPFYTTKDAGKGTGLGLSVCYDIVKSYGGRIDVQSTVGKGTTFSIQLPIRESDIQ